ncbi:MAG TPA: sugar ABC transporter permease [Anaerolineae bacterium]|nr:sugar ABC transporter permease [Anaerolineae bacterium]
MSRLLVFGPSATILAFLAFPILLALWYSLTNYKLTNVAGPQLIGLDNYLYILKDPQTLDRLVTTLKFVLLSLGIELPGGFAVALLLNRESRGIRALRTVVLMPMMVPFIVAALVWRTMMAPVEGVLNYGLSLVGLPPSAWLGSPTTALPSVVLIDVWTQIPFVSLVLLAGLQGLPREPYEAARIDGASEWQLFRYLTLPLMTPFLSLISIFRAIETFKVFDIIFATTKGGPGKSTTTLNIAAYREGFTYGSMGSALSYVFLLALLIVLVVGVLTMLWRRSSRLTSE